MLGGIFEGNLGEVFDKLMEEFMKHFLGEMLEESPVEVVLESQMTGNDEFPVEIVEESH